MKIVSILIVHYNTPGLLRQTLKGIRRAAIGVNYEVIVVDNNPECRVCSMIQKEFPEVCCIVSDTNLGFGGGMNLALKHSEGKYIFVFNPDILLSVGSIEKMVGFMDSRGDIGIVGPRLLNPDGSLQYSAYRFLRPQVILYRRFPLLKLLPFAKRAIEDYLMVNEDHSKTMEVDYLLGAALFVRRKAYEQVGGFDENFFVYFEDQDWCKRFSENGWKVVYYPDVEMIHYHRRETAEGGFLRQIFNPLTRIQIRSALYYYWKHRR